MFLHNVCDAALADCPDKIAVRCGSEALTYCELSDLADGLARHWLAAGLVHGDRVALWLPNCPEALVAYLACFRAGLIAVALDFRYQLAEAEYCLDRCSAAALVASADKAAALHAAHPVSTLREILPIGGAPRLADRLADPADMPLTYPDDVDYLSTIFFTSGTTSQPKGVTHTSRRTCNRIEKFIEETGLDRSAVSLVTISLMKPLAFQHLAMAVFHAGGTAVLLPQFTPEAFWRAYLEPPAKTLLALTPNLLAAALEHPLAVEARTRPPALWLVGGDRTAPHLHARFRDRTGGELTETCGMTETGPYAMNPPFGEKRVGSIGVPPIGVALRIVDAQENDVAPGQVGQVVVRTPDTMVGYWNDTLASYEVLREGWMRTGDLARSDMEGYVWLQGRMKDMIVRDGSNISPLEIETVALAEPGVSAAAAVGVNDPAHGEAVHLFVTAAGDDTSIDERLWKRLRADLRTLAVPDAIRRVAALPINAAGKVDKAKLRQSISE